MLGSQRDSLPGDGSLFPKLCRYFTLPTIEFPRFRTDAIHGIHVVANLGAAAGLFNRLFASL